MQTNGNQSTEIEAKILIVDDEATNVLLLERILGRVLTYQLAKTTDSRKVAELVDDFEPDLVLLDLHMPYIDGFAVLENLRREQREGDFLPVLVLTADVTPQAKLRALASGATDFLTKPFDKSEVLLRVENLLRTRQLHLQVQAQNEALEEMVQRRTGELQQALTKLQETQQQVVQQERLHALGMMASGVAHDFNNALSVILGFGELVLQECRRIPGTEAVGGHAQTIVTAALDGADMVRRLREFYRPDVGIGLKVQIDLKALVEQAITLTQPRWKTQSLSLGRPIEMVTEFGEALPVKGDAAELREALTNLIFNATDAMPTGGRITFRTGQDGEHTMLEVSDTGTGMTEEVRRRCLEPFFSTKGKNGTGLGLAMVYGIVERHAGSLEIDSELGRGTTFRLRMPSQEADEEQTEPAIRDLGRLLKVLLVDDQPVLCEIYTEYLKHDWHTVETANSGEEALEKFKAGAFDLVITDLSMAGRSGEQLAAEIREISPGTPIILLTGYSGYEISEEATQNVSIVLTKPVSLTDLRQAIARTMLEIDEPQLSNLGSTQ
jgi:signal transduction histidine kinase